MWERIKEKWDGVHTVLEVEWVSPGATAMLTNSTEVSLDRDIRCLRWWDAGHTGDQLSVSM